MIQQSRYDPTNLRGTTPPTPSPSTLVRQVEILREIGATPEVIVAAEAVRDRALAEAPFFDPYLYRLEMNRRFDAGELTGQRHDSPSPPAPLPWWKRIFRR